MVAQIDRAYIRHRPSKVLSRLASYALFEGRPLTTRGRWLNHIVFGLLGMQKAFKPPVAVRSPVFITGTGRSGTTVLGIVMSMHRDVGFLNEPKAIWHSAYPHEDLVGSYSGGDARYSLGSTEATTSVSSAMHRIYGWYLWITRSERIVDKYPELIFREPFVREIFPDAKFIFLVRNGWDTCQSIEHWSERLGGSRNGEVHDWWGVNNRKWDFLLEELVKTDQNLAPAIEGLKALKKHTDMAAVEWILAMRAGIKLRERRPESVLTVHYERLVAEPAQVLDEIRSFCGLQKDDVYIAYGEEVLRPGRAARPFEMSSLVEPLFRATMVELGYKL